MYHHPYHIRIDMYSGCIIDVSESSLIRDLRYIRNTCMIRILIHVSHERRTDTPWYVTNTIPIHGNTPEYNVSTPYTYRRRCNTSRYITIHQWYMYYSAADTCITHQGLMSHTPRADRHSDTLLIHRWYTDDTRDDTDTIRLLGPLAAPLPWYIMIQIAPMIHHDTYMIHIQYTMIHFGMWYAYNTCVHVIRRDTHWYKRSIMHTIIHHNTS